MILQARRIARQIEAVGGYAVVGKSLLHLAAQRRVTELGAFKVETRIRNRVQDLGPGRHHAFAHLGEVIKGAEGHIPVLHKRRRRHLDIRMGRPVTQETAGERQQPLAHGGFALLGGVGHPIDHAVVHGLEPGGVGIAQPRHLKRRGFAGKHQQPVARRVAVQIHQNIDAVVAYQGSHRIVAHADDGAPVGCQALQTPGHLVGTCHLGVTGDLHTPGIMGGQQRLQETAHRMAPQIRRYVTHLQFTLRIAVVAVGSDGARRHAVNGIELTMGGQHHRRVLRSVVHGKQQIGMGHRVAGINLQRLAAGGARLCHTSLKHQQKSQIGIKGRIVRV